MSVLPTTIMNVTLNEDIFTLIYSHTFDFEVLRITVTAISINKQHPLHNVVPRRLLQLPLRLSSETLKDSKALIDHFVHNPTHVDLVRDIAVVLGPSRKTIARNVEIWGNARPEELEKVERAEVLFGLLPGLLVRTGNLQHLDWSKYPPPNGEILKGLSEQSFTGHLSLDCSVESNFVSVPPEPVGSRSRNQ